MCKSKCNTFTLLKLENVFTTYSCTLYFILFHVLHSRKASFIYSMRSKTVDLFTLFFFILATPLLVMHFHIYAVSIIVCFFLFLTPTFFTYGGPSWVGIKKAIQLWKVNSNPKKEQKEVSFKECSKQCNFFQTTNLEWT